MHVRTVVSSGTESSDVELAQLLLLWQLNVMAEVTVVALLYGKKCVLWMSGLRQQPTDNL